MSLPPVEIPLGAMRFNSDSQKLEYFNGEVWMQVHTFNPDLNGGARGTVNGGGDGSNRINTVEYFTIPTAGNSIDFGDLNANRGRPGACASNTRALVAGGYTGSGMLATIDYYDFSSTGTITNFSGDLTLGRNQVAGCSNSTRGLFAGGNPETDIIDYVTIASQGVAAQDFGNLSGSTQNPSAL